MENSKSETNFKLIVKIYANELTLVNNHSNIPVSQVLKIIYISQSEKKDYQH